MDIKLYLKAAAALAVMGTVSFMVFDGLLGKRSDQRAPVAALALAEGGADYVHGRDPVALLAAPVALGRAEQKATPFASSYRLTEDVAGRVYRNGVDVEGEMRLVPVDGGWKAPFFIRASRQLPPDTWQPRAAGPAAGAARCPAGSDRNPLVGMLTFAEGVSRPLPRLPAVVQAGDVLTGCIEAGEKLPLSSPNPVLTRAEVKGTVSHRGRLAVLFDISAAGASSYAGYALVDPASGLVVFSDIEARFGDPAAHGGYDATIHELDRIDLR